MAQESIKQQALNLDQFRSLAEPKMWDRIFGVEGTSLMCCHVRTFRQTGIWIEDLVPVFLKLDAVSGQLKK